MYFKFGKVGNLTAVVSTQDGVIDLVDDEFLNVTCKNIPIEEDFKPEFIPDDLVYRTSRKLYRECLRGNNYDIEEFFKTTFFYPLALKLKSYKRVSVEKVFDYNELCGFMLVILSYTEDNETKLAFVTIQDNGASVVRLLQRFNCHFKTYPSGSGYLYNMLFKRNLNIDLGLPEGNIYLMIYSSDYVYLISATSFETVKAFPYKGKPLV